MALVTANQFDLVPNIAGQFQQGRLAGQQQQQLRQTQQKQELAGQFSSAALGGDKQALQDLAGTDIKQAENVRRFLSNQSETERQETIRENEVLTRGAINALRLPPEQRRSFVQQERDKAAADGRSTEKTDSALSGSDQEFNQNLQLQASQGLKISELAKQVFPDAGKGQDRDLRERQLAIAESSEKRQAGKLSAGLENALIAAQDRTVVAQRNANEFDVLAKDFERLNIAGGVKGTFSEQLKSILGTQDDVSEFRRRFNKVRLSEGLKNLPPGPATDRDVQEAFKGVPKDNASAEQVASFLRGAARISRFEAGFNQFKSDFISNESSAKGLNREWRRQIESPVAKRKVSVAEIYETAQNRSITPEEVAQKLGINDARFTR